jgi:hypothetical protein
MHLVFQAHIEQMLTLIQPFVNAEFQARKALVIQEEKQDVMTQLFPSAVEMTAVQMIG